MGDTFSSLVIILGIVLPGWLSVSIAARYKARTGNGSALHDWGEIVFHAAIVHTFATVTIILLVIFFRDFFITELDIPSIFDSGLVAYIKVDVEQRFLFVFGYLVGLIVFAIGSGVFDGPERITYGATSLAVCLGLVRTKELIEHPTWFEAFRVGRELAGASSVLLNLTMKSGLVITGNLKTYSVSSDVDDKEIYLEQYEITRHDHGDSETLPTRDSYGDGIIVNATDVESIEFIYHNEYVANAGS